MNKNEHIKRPIDKLLEEKRDELAETVCGIFAQPCLRSMYYVSRTELFNETLGIYKAGWDARDKLDKDMRDLMKEREQIAIAALQQVYDADICAAANAITGLALEKLRGSGE